MNSLKPLVLATALAVASFAASAASNPGDRVYTADQNTNTVSVIDPNTNALLGQIKLVNLLTTEQLRKIYKGEINVHGLGFSPDHRTLVAIANGSNSVTFIDTATNKVSYWADPRFVAKRPGGDGPPDNFYRAMANGSMKQVVNTLHDDSEAARDIAGLNALVSWHFWYFGDQSPPLPTDLVHLTHSGQGHSLHRRRRADDVAVLQHWLDHWPMGRNGAPVDAWRPRVFVTRRA